MQGLVKVEDAFEMAVVAAIEGKSYAQILKQKHKERQARIDAAARRMKAQLPPPPAVKIIETKSGYEERVKREKWIESWRNMIRLARLRQELDNQTQSIFEEPFRVRKPNGALGKIILIETAHKYGVTVDQIVGLRRDTGIIQPRFEVFWRLWYHANYSLPGAGRLVGGRDHTTALNGRLQYERWQRVKAGKEAPIKNDKHIDFDKVIDGVRM